MVIVGKDAKFQFKAKEFDRDDQRLVMQTENRHDEWYAVHHWPHTNQNISSCSGGRSRSVALLAIVCDSHRPTDQPGNVVLSLITSHFSIALFSSSYRTRFDLVIEVPS